MSALSNMAFGSVTTRVLHLCHIPVVLTTDRRKRNGRVPLARGARPRVTLRATRAQSSGLGASKEQTLEY